MDKRGMEMSLNTVIVAVIALLVLAVMVYLLGKNIGLFHSGTSCVSEGGHCVLRSECIGDYREVTSSNENSRESLCKKTNEMCCSLVPSN